ncbi:glycosyltransferase family 39 protein [Candidatus Woesearchaeota archaeon]|nr:glycosyltransferase family 39 protein [Candidatus Woesearchaeota archaeon]
MEEEPKSEKSINKFIGNKFIGKLDWEDWLFILLVIIYLTAIIWLILEFKQLPSPIYGGDYYHSLGYVEHFKGGGNAFVSSTFIGSLPAYFPTYTILAGGIAKLFSMDSSLAMKIFAVIEAIFALLVFYLLGKALFKKKLLALIAVVLYFPLIGGFPGFPVLKYLQFTRTFFLPLTILTFFYFFKKRDLKSAILAGIVWGLLGISHSVGFIVASLFIAFISLNLLFFEHVKYEKKKFSFLKESFKKNFFPLLKLLFIIFIIGFIIAQLYWFKPLFVYHAQPLNPIQEFDQFDFNRLDIKFYFIKQGIESFLWNFSSVFAGIKSVFFLAGLFLLFFIRKYTPEIKFLIIFLITTLIGSFHYFISQPIIGTNLSAYYFRNFSFYISTTFLAIFAIMVVSDFLKNKLRIKENIKYVLLVVLVIILIFNFVQAANYQKTNKWINVGRQPLSANLIEMQKWVLANTDVNDVFLSTNELSHALNGLTGRKLVTLKRGHTELFTNATKNMIDAAIILYSNNTAERERVIKERNAKYLYWDYYWIRSEYIFNEQGQLADTFDPLVIFDTPDSHALLKYHNISYYTRHTWLDPAIRDARVKQFDIIFILPYKFDFTHPWHPDLDNYLEEAWNFSQNGVVVSRIYKIVNVD